MTKNTPAGIEEPLLLTLMQAAKRLGVPAITVKQLCDDGRLPSSRLANRTMIPAASLVEFVEAIKAAS